jgi:hypothetical protein
MSDTFLVLIQTGFQRSAGRRPGQLVKAFLVFKDGGEEAISWSQDPEQGSFLSDRIDKQRFCWYMSKKYMTHGDVLRVEIFTGARGLGEDPNLTQQRLYLLDENAPVREFIVPNVGFKRFPLVKGRLQLVNETSRRDRIEVELSSMIDDEEKM